MNQMITAEFFGGPRDGETFAYNQSSDTIDAPRFINERTMVIDRYVAMDETRTRFRYDGQWGS